MPGFMNKFMNLNIHVGPFNNHEQIHEYIQEQNHEYIHEYIMKFMNKCMKNKESI